MSVWSPTMMNDTTANCAITAGDDAGNFDVNASTCAITVSETASFDHETSPTIILTVAASTAGDLESDSQDVSVSVTDVNDAPVGDLVITYTDGLDNNGDGDYNGTGVDNNNDGDFDDPGVDNNGDGDFLDDGVDNLSLIHI